MTRSKRKGKRIIKRAIQNIDYIQSKKHIKYNYLDYGENNKLSWENNGKKYELKYLDSYFLSNPILNDKDAHHMFEYTKERDCVFFTELVGYVIFIHNGHEWIEHYIIKDIVLHQFGKFAYTRKRCFYKNKKKKKRIIKNR